MKSAGGCNASLFSPSFSGFSLKFSPLLVETIVTGPRLASEVSRRSLSLLEEKVGSERPPALKGAPKGAAEGAVLVWALEAGVTTQIRTAPAFPRPAIGWQTAEVSGARKSGRPPSGQFKETAKTAASEMPARTVAVLAR
jgi:hypothetical protein